MNPIEAVTTSIGAAAIGWIVLMSFVAVVRRIPWRSDSDPKPRVGGMPGRRVVLIAVGYVSTSVLVAWIGETISVSWIGAEAREDWRPAVFAVAVGAGLVWFVILAFPLSRHDEYRAVRQRFRSVIAQLRARRDAVTKDVARTQCPAGEVIDPEIGRSAQAVADELTNTTSADSPPDLVPAKAKLLNWARSLRATSETVRLLSHEMARRGSMPPIAVQPPLANQPRACNPPENIWEWRILARPITFGSGSVAVVVIAVTLILPLYGYTGSISAALVQASVVAATLMVALVMSLPAARFPGHSSRSRLWSMAQLSILALACLVASDAVNSLTAGQVATAHPTSPLGLGAVGFGAAIVFGVAAAYVLLFTAASIRVWIALWLLVIVGAVAFLGPRSLAPFGPVTLAALALIVFVAVHAATTYIAATRADRSQLSTERTAICWEVDILSRLLDSRVRAWVDFLHGRVQSELLACATALDLVANQASANDEAARSTDPTTVRDRILHVVATLQEVVEGLRSGRPWAATLPSTQDLMGALEDSVKAWNGVVAMRIGATRIDHDWARTPEVMQLVIDIVGEGTANAVRHAGAESIHVSIESTAREVTVRMEDDGRFRLPTGSVGIGFPRLRSRGVQITLEPQSMSGAIMTARVIRHGGDTDNYQSRLEGDPSLTSAAETLEESQWKADTR